MNPSFWIKKAIFFGMAFCSTLIPITDVVYGEKIEEIKVDIRSEAHPLSDTVKKRISQSITSIGKRIFEGKEADSFIPHQKQYNRVLSDVINRVVMGYVVTDVEVKYGKTATIGITLMPVGQSVKTVETTIDYGGLSEEAISYIKKDIGQVEELMESLLVGLPVDSIGWAENVSQSAGKERLKEKLPEFDSTFEVTPGDHTKIRIYLIPKGEIVRSSAISFRRMDIPRLLMWRSTLDVENKMKALEGLPVSFVNRHHGDISSDMEATLKDNPIMKKYHIAVGTDLQAGAHSILYIDAKTKVWVIRTEGWFDVNRRENKNYAFHGIVGYYWRPHDQVFAEVVWYPGPMEWNLFGGWQHRIGRSLAVGGKYDVANREAYVFGKVRVNERTLILCARNLTEETNEFEFLYKLHNYMTAEYVYNNRDGNWLRLIANL